MEARRKFRKVINPLHTQVVVAACVEHIRSEKRLYLVSLHLKSGYEEQEKRRRREFKKAMQLVVAEFPEILWSPVVVAGDLNSDFTSIHATLIKDLLPTMNKSPDFPTLSNAAAKPNGMGETLPTYNFWHHSVFDYILVSNDISVEHMYTQEAREKAPNKTQGSDHFPVTAHLTF